MFCHLLLFVPFLTLRAESCLSFSRLGTLRQPFCLCFYFGDCDSLMNARHRIDQVHMTGSEINHSFLFHRVLKILPACRMLKISIARCQIEPEIHSFPTMYIMGGVNMFEMGQINDFVQKIAPKSCFFTDTYLVLPTLGGSGTPKS